MATDPLSIFLASSCIGSFWGNARTGPAVQRVQPPPPGRERPGGAMRDRVENKRRQLYLGVRHHGVHGTGGGEAWMRRSHEKCSFVSYSHLSAQPALYEPVASNAPS